MWMTTAWLWSITVKGGEYVALALARVAVDVAVERLRRDRRGRGEGVGCRDGGPIVDARRGTSGTEAGAETRADS